MKTAECVSPGHPDKMADQISDAILDLCLKLDPNARVAIETMGGHGKIDVMGEITMTGKILLRENIYEIIGRITGENVITDIQINIVNQSQEIANGVDTGGAGDQGIMVGYACDENEGMIPQELWLARLINKRIYKKFPFDGKTQITLKDDGVIETVVASFQNVSKMTLEQEVIDWLREIDPEHSEEVKILCNPAGNWSQGGFDADTGLTGRKLMVDNYGPQIPIGGGAFSGKDATKVDRSAAYMARKIAVDFLKSEKGHGSEDVKVMVKIAYAIGVKMPVMANVVIEHKKGYAEYDLLKISHGYDLTPKGIIEYLGLRRPQFERLAAQGHFGTSNIWDK